MFDRDKVGKEAGKLHSLGLQMTEDYEYFAQAKVSGESYGELLAAYKARACDVTWHSGQVIRLLCEG